MLVSLQAKKVEEKTQFDDKFTQVIGLNYAHVMCHRIDYCYCQVARLWVFVWQQDGKDKEEWDKYSDDARLTSCGWVSLLSSYSLH